MLTDTKDQFLVSAALTQPTPKIFTTWGKLSLVAANLSQPTPKMDLLCRLDSSQLTPFKRYRLQLYLNISNLNTYMIQIHIGFKIHIKIFTYIHSNNSQIYFTIFKFIVCIHFHIVENSKVHQLFTEKIFHIDKVEGTALTPRSCRRMCHLHERSHDVRTCKCPL
jgi:hypothetical protein